jgi:hypothetical protein
MRREWMALVLVLLMIAGCGRSKPAPPDTSIWDAVAGGNREIVEAHIAAETPLDQTLQTAVFGRGGTPLHVASLSRQVGIVEVLLEGGADIHAMADDGVGGTPLHWAAYVGSLAVAELLLNEGADVNAGDASGFTALDVVLVNTPNFDVVTVDDLASLLRARGGVVRVPPAVPFWDAVYAGYVDAVKAHISGGVSLDQTIEVAEMGVGASPLHVAAAMGHGALVEALLTLGASVEAQATGDVGGTPLHWAAYLGRSAIVVQLVEAGADVNSVSETGATPLDAAIDNVSGEITELSQGIIDFLGAQGALPGEELQGD